jgi:hypothetical protein
MQLGYAIDYGSDDSPITAPKPPKRKLSARAAFRMEEISKVAEAMTGTYAQRDQLLFRCNTVWGLGNESL